jgi:tyrosyl-tRNA synthetase
MAGIDQKTNLEGAIKSNRALQTEPNVALEVQLQTKLNGARTIRSGEN